MTAINDQSAADQPTVGAAIDAAAYERLTRQLQTIATAIIELTESKALCGELGDEMVEALYAISIGQCDEVSEVSAAMPPT